MNRLWTMIAAAGIAAAGQFSIPPTPAAAQSELFTLCKARTGPLWYIVPRSGLDGARGNLGSCNFFNQPIHSTVELAAQAACWRIRNGGSTANWPQYGSTPRDFGLYFSC